MIPKNGLPKLLSGLFGVLEVVMAIACVIICSLVLLVPGSTSVSVVSNMAKIGIVPEGGALTLKSDLAPSEDIQITRLQGVLRWRSGYPGNGLNILDPRLMLPIALAHCGFFVVLFDLLRRLFHNVSCRESFTERNIRLIHWVGAAILVFTLASAATQSWYQYKVTAYLEQHARMAGMKVRFAPPPPSSTPLFSINTASYEFHIGWEGILTGLLVLALGEVFRQGLVLKEENELTV